MDVATLQDRLEERARKEAAFEAKEIVNKLPPLNDYVIIRRGWATNAANQQQEELKLWFENYKTELCRAYEKSIYKTRLQELTQALVDDVVLVR